MTAVTPTALPVRRPWYAQLYVQVLIAIALGVAVGHFYPDWGKALKPLGDAFVALIKMMIAPVIFCTIVHGIASMRDLKAVGRVGLKAVLYFEVVSTVALIIGMAVGHLLQPGADFGNGQPLVFDESKVSTFVDQAKKDSVVAHLMAIIPQSFLSPFTSGDLLQVLLVAILFGVAVSQLGVAGEKIAGGIELAGKVFFRVIGMVVRLAPLGAFGAMAYTVGAFGVAALVNLGFLVATFYITSLLFVLIVLGSIAAACGFNILRFIAYIKDELLIVLGTSSSESALPQLMQKMQRLGASKPVVGLVVPTGYSFNLDGTNIYMTLSVLFLAQASGVDLSWGHFLTILGVAMLTSKGASGVTGAGFITLAATLAVVPDIPIGSLALLVGIDKFMSECRALTNLVGNGVACVVISRWEKELDPVKLRQVMAHPVLEGDRMEAQIAAGTAEPVAVPLEKRDPQVGSGAPYGA